MKLQCRSTTGLSSFSNAPATVETAGTRKLARSEGKISAKAPIKSITAKESAEQTERVAMEEREERVRVRIAKERTESLSGDEDVELRTPLTKKSKRDFDFPSNFSKVAAPGETTDAGKVDIHHNLGLGSMSARVSIPSQNERFTDAERESPEPTYPTMAREVAPEAWKNTTPGLLETPKDVKEELPTTPKPWPAPPLATAQLQVPTPAPAPAKSEPEKPLSLWERKKIKAQHASASTSGVWGDAGGSGGNAETIAMPTLTGNGDRQSIFTDTAHGQKRENQPSPHAQKSGWGWGGSLLNEIANAVAVPDRSPSPETAPVKPKIEEASTPAESEEDEFDWANVGKKKKGQLASVAQMPSVLNTPDPDNADDGPPGGAGSRKKKKGRR